MHTDADERHPWVPGDACTLPTAQQPLRLAEFDALFADHLVGVERLDAQRVSLRLEGGGPVRADAQDLANRETSCCSFFAFDVRPVGADSVQMDITVPPERAAVLDALVARAAQAARRTA
ncbi:MAG: hypothetical protein ACLGIG_08975 [Actinomycetes bacterium]